MNIQLQEELKSVSSDSHGIRLWQATVLATCFAFFILLCVNARRRRSKLKIWGVFNLHAIETTCRKKKKKKKKRISETYKIAGISYDYELQPSLITHITVDYWLCVKCFTGNKNIFRWISNLRSLWNVPTHMLYILT